MFLPNITKKLQMKVQDFVGRHMKRLKDEKASEAIFRLQSLQQGELLKGPALLSLAEFGKIHFDPFGPEIIDILLQKIGQEITAENQREIEAGLLGLRSLAGKDNRTRVI